LGSWRRFHRLFLRHDAAHVRSFASEFSTRPPHAPLPIRFKGPTNRLDAGRFCGPREQGRRAQRTRPESGCEAEDEARRRKPVSIRSHAAPLFCRSVGRQHNAEDGDNEDQEPTKLLSPYLTFDDLAFLRRFGRFIGHAQRDTSFQARIRPACLHRNQADDRLHKPGDRCRSVEVRSTIV